MKDEIMSECKDDMGKTPEQIWNEFCLWYLRESEKRTVNYLEEKQKFEIKGKSPIQSLKKD